LKEIVSGLYAVYIITFEVLLSLLKGGL